MGRHARAFAASVLPRTNRWRTGAGLGDMGGILLRVVDTSGSTTAGLPARGGPGGFLPIASREGPANHVAAVISETGVTGSGPGGLAASRGVFGQCQRQADPAQGNGDGDV